VSVSTRLKETRDLAVMRLSLFLLMWLLVLMCGCSSGLVQVWNENYDESCDLWSAGVIMYVLLCSYPPFDGDSDKDILRSVCRGKYSFPSPEWDDVSVEVRSAANTNRGWLSLFLHA